MSGAAGAAAVRAGAATWGGEDVEGQEEESEEETSEGEEGEEAESESESSDDGGSCSTADVYSEDSTGMLGVAVGEPALRTQKNDVSTSSVSASAITPETASESTVTADTGGELVVPEAVTRGGRRRKSDGVPIPSPPTEPSPFLLPLIRATLPFAAGALAAAAVTVAEKSASGPSVSVFVQAALSAVASVVGTWPKPRPSWHLDEVEGMLPFRVERTAFPRSRFDTIRFFAAHEDPNSRNTGVLYVPKANKQRMLYFRIHKAVRHNCVQGAFRRAGMKESKRDKWNILWGKRWKDDDYLTLNPFQKVNHFPGTWHIGRKDMLFRNLQRMRRAHGPDNYGFFPQTFLLPHDTTLLSNEIDALRSEGRSPVFIVKPPASSCGRGIHLISHPSEIPREDAWICQRYIGNPLLISGFKCDLRLYAAITSFDPLRIYLLQDGLCRFATEKYKRGESHLGNRYMHLTNYSVNRKSAKFKKNTNADEDDVGSKWSLRGLKRYFLRQGMDWDGTWARIKDCVIKTMLSCEAVVTSKITMFVKHRGSCFELYGIDVLLDSELMPTILEVNIMPALSCGSPLDKRIKGQLVANLLNLVGVQPYDRKQFSEQQEMRRRKRLLGFNSTAIRDPSPGSRPRSTSGSGTGKKKPATAAPKSEDGDADFERRWCNNLPISSGKGKAADSLTQASFADLGEEDKEVIRDTEDEYQRRGGFERIFPTRKTGEMYNAFFESPRYYNTLLWLWEKEKARCDEHERRMLLSWLRMEGQYPSAPLARTSSFASSEQKQQRGRTLHRSSSSRRVASAPNAERERPPPPTSAAPPSAAARAPEAAPAVRVPSAVISPPEMPSNRSAGRRGRQEFRTRGSSSQQALKSTPIGEETDEVGSSQVASGANPNRGHRSNSLLVSPATIASTRERWRNRAGGEDVSDRYQAPTTILAPRPMQVDSPVRGAGQARSGESTPHRHRLVMQRFEAMSGRQGAKPRSDLIGAESSRL